jgi:hypothetical protein
MIMKTRRAIGLIVLGLYLVTWLPAGVMIRHERGTHSPTVFPVLPFLVLACDRKPSLAGEWAIYAAYGIGMWKLLEVHTWIA